jgi:hypothetical protein
MPFDNPRHTPFGDVETLTDARNRISDQNTWVQGRFQDGGRRCLVAALSLASGSRSVSLPNRTEKRLARVLAKQLRPGSRFWHRVPLIPARQHLMWFNDDSRTSHEDVMALFDRAICNLTTKVPSYIAG